MKMKTNLNLCLLAAGMQVLAASAEYPAAANGMVYVLQKTFYSTEDCSGEALSRSSIEGLELEFTDYTTMMFNRCFRDNDDFHGPSSLKSKYFLQVDEKNEIIGYTSFNFDDDACEGEPVNNITFSDPPQAPPMNWRPATRNDINQTSSNRYRSLLLGSCQNSTHSGVKEIMNVVEKNISDIVAMFNVRDFGDICQPGPQSYFNFAETPSVTLELGEIWSQYRGGDLDVMTLVTTNGTSPCINVENVGSFLFRLKPHLSLTVYDEAGCKGSASFGPARCIYFFETTAWVILSGEELLADKINANQPPPGTGTSSGTAFGVDFLSIFAIIVAFMY